MWIQVQFWAFEGFLHVVERSDRTETGIESLTGWSDRGYLARGSFLAGRNQALEELVCARERKLNGWIYGCTGDTPIA